MGTGTTTIKEKQENKIEAIHHNTDSSINAKVVEEEKWTLVIEPSSGLFDLQLKEVWRYRDLLQMFVKRDFISVYKQTILGPIWFFLQPLFTTITFTLVFGKIAGISTSGVPPLLFYMAGITCWNYFSACITSTSSTFRGNAGIFGKVYFPRIISPLSVIVSNMLKLGVQLALFFGFLFYYIVTGASVEPNIYILLLPILIIMMAVMALGLGMLISAMTTKYRDLQFLIGFSVQLAMYASTVIYPISEIPEKYKFIILANPMSSIIETFRFAFLGAGTLPLAYLAYSCVFSLVVFLSGVIVFNRVEKSFLDTV